MAKHPAPVVCHLTDGEFTGEDPRPIVEKIKNLACPTRMCWWRLFSSPIRFSHIRSLARGNGKEYWQIHRRSPLIRHDNLPLTIAAFSSRLRLRKAALILFGLHYLMPAHPALHASLRSSCPSSLGFALRLPPHAHSHEHSCLLLAVCRINVRRGFPAFPMCPQNPTQYPPAHHHLPPIWPQ
jgi:hypothetical protein